MGHRAPSHSKQPCPGTRGSAWVDRNTPLLLVGTIMDEANSKLSQTEITSNVGADNTSAIVKVEENRAEGPAEFGPPSAKKQCKQREPETAQQMTEGDAGSAGGPSELSLAPKPGNAIKTEPPSPSFWTHTTQNGRRCIPAKPMPVEDRSTFPSFRFMNVKMKLGLCAANHPRVCLTPFQLETLAQIILDMILGPEGQRVKPRFYGMTMEGGYLMLVCGDYATISWVKELPTKLFLGNIRLKVVERPKESKTFMVVGHFPKSEGESIQRILRFLEIQNDGLDCSQWRVLDRHEEKKAVRMTFAIDWDSVHILKAKGPLLNFKFGGARFMLKTKRGVKFKEEECEDDDFEFLDSVPDCLPVLDPFINPFAQMNSFDYDFAYDWPCGSQMQMNREDLEGFDYSAQVAAAVGKAKTALRNGLTSRERFLRGRRNRKKKKKAKAKAEAS